MMDIYKDWVLKLIKGAHDAGYIQLRNDLILDIQHLLTDRDLKNILDMLHSDSPGKKKSKRLCKKQVTAADTIKINRTPRYTFK